MRSTLTTFLVALALAVSSAGPAVHAASGMRRDGPITLAQSDGVTLDQAVEQVRRQYGGRIVSAETRRRGNREVHYIKVLTADGKVKSVQVQGRTVKKG